MRGQQTLPTQRVPRSRLGLGFTFVHFYVAHPSDPIGQLPLPILVDVDGHRLRHYVAIQTDLEIEQAWIRIPGRGIFRIGIHASVIDHLSAVQPPLKEAAFV